MIHEGDLYGIADFDGARVRRVFAGEDVEQGGLARAVRADDAEDGAGRQVEAEVFVEGFVRVAFGKVFGDDDFVAEALARRDVDFLGFGAFLEFFAGEFVEAGEARLVFAVAAFGVVAHPFEFLFEGAAVRGFLFFFDGQAFFFLFQPGGVVALVGDTFAAVEFEYPASDVVEEVAVVGDGDDGAGEVVQVALQPGDGFSVEVVGRFVQKQHVRVGEEQAAEGNAAFFATGERCDWLFPRRQAQRVGGDFHAALVVMAAARGQFVFQLGLFGGERVKVRIRVGVGGVNGIEFGLYVFHVAHRFFDDFAHGFFGVKLRFLRQVADADAGLRPRFALDVGIHARHDFQQGGFARAV